MLFGSNPLSNFSLIFTMKPVVVLVGHVLPVVLVPLRQQFQGLTLTLQKSAKRLKILALYHSCWTKNLEACKLDFFFFTNKLEIYCQWRIGGCY